MNLHRQQRRYVFHKPKYAPWLMPVIYRLADWLFMRGKFKIGSVEVFGAGPVAELARRNMPVLVAPNHADHADPSILLHVGRRHGLTFHFMAAREGFELGALPRFILQRAGAFSVDREGADLAAIKTAIQILQLGRHPLVIFPEGEIYHHHEWLDNLNEGVATILLRASAKLPPERSAYLVPCSILIAWDDQVSATFDPRLRRLEERVTWRPRPDLDWAERIYRLGSGLLALKEEEYQGQARAGTLEERILHLQEALIRTVEANQNAPALAGQGVPERVRALRGKIRRLLLDENAPPSVAEVEQLHGQLDTLFLVSQLYSYSGHYLRQRPSVSRLAETLFKLEEDLFGEGTYVGPRHVRVTFDPPIDIRRFLSERNLDAKSGVAPLTKHLEERLRALLQDSDRSDAARIDQGDAKPKPVA